MTADVHDFEIPNLVNKLISYLGRQDIEKHIQKYKLSFQSSGPVFREYYLKIRHPWWNAFIQYFELERTGKSIRRNLSAEIIALAGDAKKVTTLSKIMPDSVRNEYRMNLLDDDRAYDYLFEIQIAWHFYLEGCVIQWYKNSREPHPEFLVTSSNLQFNVECKRISVDASRRIRRRDFYRLAEKLIVGIKKENLSGSIDIRLKDKLHSNEAFLIDLTSQTLKSIQAGKVIGDYQIPL